MLDGDLEHRFAFHPATDDEKRNAHTSVRAACLTTAKRINELAPDGREKSLAITALEEAMMWGNAALARGPSPYAGPPR
jgi:hypothetical protein